MYISINSKAEFGPDDGPGKTTWVNDDPKWIVLRDTTPSHLGDPPWHIEVSLEHAVHHASGARTGNLVSVVRNAKLELTPDDIDAILKVLGEAGVLRVSVRERAV